MHKNELHVDITENYDKFLFIFNHIKSEMLSVHEEKPKEIE